MSGLRLCFRRLFSSIAFSIRWFARELAFDSGMNGDLAAGSRRSAR